MKSFTFLLVVIFLLLFSSSSIYSQDSIKVMPRMSKKTVDKNYLQGVKSDNEGLRISSAYYLGERESSHAIIPLMNMLHTDKSPEARIMAALSLFKIGDARGIYAIKEAITYDKSEWVQNMCKVFYRMYEENQKADKKK
jgi:HEAT repeats